MHETETEREREKERERARVGGREKKRGKENKRRFFVAESEEVDHLKDLGIDETTVIK
jgi:predicted ATP-grasp superfamily ATP-dependent carboligase